MTRSISRRAVLASAAVAGCCFRWSPAIAAPASFTIRQGLFTGVGLPGIFAAIQQGYFAQQGIQIDLQFFGNGPAMISALLGGSLDITHADTLSWATAVLGGRDLMLVTPASLAPTPDGDPKSTWRIAVSKKSGITTPQGLIGHRIGVGASQLSMVSLKAWLAQNGVDPNAVHLEIVGQPQAMPNMLSSGAVDAALFGDPTIEQIDRQIGVTIIGWPYEVVPPQATFSGLFSTRDYAVKNKDAAVRYVRAFRQGAVYFNHASQLERARLMKLADIDIEALDKKFPGLLDAFRYNRAADQPIDILETQRWVDIGVQYGGVPKPVDIAGYVSETAKGSVG